jgi:hypothetical protein
MREIKFQDLMVKLINEKLDNKKFVAYRGKALLYELWADEDLNIVGDPKNPKRGSGAFETDVTIFAKKDGIEVPFIIIEVKESITTHDIIIYSNKASRHKTVYPFLRYGLVAYDLDTIPKRFFKHNKEIDFFLAVSEYIDSDAKLSKILFELVKNELKIFENLQKILHNKDKSDFYQNIPKLSNFDQNGN